jgi:hypothetical protein
VNSGVRELSIPARELLILVWALVNNKAGMAKPSTPATMREGMFFLESTLKFLMMKGDTNRKLKNILRAATWKLLKDSRPFFIRINELPQIIERTSRVISCDALLSNLIAPNKKP